jgi:murein DD-endopeptidase MepM/ murein hydrolase activator NlpD
MMEFRSDQNTGCQAVKYPRHQPVSNKQLNRIASGFGMRIDPVYGTPKMHKGSIFTAPQETVMPPVMERLVWLALQKAVMETM